MKREQNIIAVQYLIKGIAFIILVLLLVSCAGYKEIHQTATVYHKGLQRHYTYDKIMGKKSDPLKNAKNNFRTAKKQAREIERKAKLQKKIKDIHAKTAAIKKGNL